MADDVTIPNPVWSTLSLTAIKCLLLNFILIVITPCLAGDEWRASCAVTDRSAK